MKRAHLPAYSPAASQRATAARLSQPLRSKPDDESVAEPVFRWPSYEIGGSFLSFPRDLRPHLPDDDASA